ncbi:uncharacterized protein O3C94_018835 isoform 1-T1 [Discoglossus pictus]
MDGNKQAPAVLSGILEKRRQNLKFQWRTYRFILEDLKLSYYKTRGSSDKEGELWGTIDIRDQVCYAFRLWRCSLCKVQSLCPVEPSGHRYPMEMTLRSGKVILLSAQSSLERARWLQTIQEKLMAMRKRCTSDIPVIREKATELGGGRVLCEWMAEPKPVIESESTGSKNDTVVAELADLDTFIDETFSGITFNRQSQMVKKETQHQMQECNRNKT